MSFGTHIPRAPPQVCSLSARPAVSHPVTRFQLTPFRQPFRACIPRFDSLTWHRIGRGRIAVAYCSEKGGLDGINASVEESNMSSTRLSGAYSDSRRRTEWSLRRQPCDETVWTRYGPRLGRVEYSAECAVQRDATSVRSGLPISPCRNRIPTAPRPGTLPALSALIRPWSFRNAGEGVTCPCRDVTLGRHVCPCQ